MIDHLQAAIDKLEMIPLRRYCQITGESHNAIHQRKFKGIWKEGVHLFKPDGSDWWVSLPAVREWVRGEGGEPAELDAELGRAAGRERGESPVCAGA